MMMMHYLNIEFFSLCILQNTPKASYSLSSSSRNQFFPFSSLHNQLDQMKNDSVSIKLSLLPQYFTTENCAILVDSFETPLKFASRLNCYHSSLVVAKIRRERRWKCTELFFDFFLSFVFCLFDWLVVCRCRSLWIGTIFFLLKIEKSCLFSGFNELIWNQVIYNPSHDLTFRLLL